MFSGTAYSAFGEPYAPKGPTNNQFAGLTSDISSGTEQVSLSRRYHPGQGRWISPDGEIPDVFNPQTFNAYHYALNSPTSVTDPTGLTDCPQGKTCNCPIEGCAGVDILGADNFWNGGCSPGMNALNCSDLGPLGLGAGSGNSSFSFSITGDFNTCNSDFMPCGFPMPSWQQSLWSDVLGLPTLPCATALGPWCNGQGLVNPAMDVGAGPRPLKDISPCLQKAQQAWSDAKSTYLSEVGLGGLGTGIMVGLAFVPGVGEIEGEGLLHLLLHGSPAAAPGPILMFHGTKNLDLAYHDYLNQTANCTP